MSLKSIYCIVTSRGRVDSMLVDLRDEGFSPAEISILFLDPDTSLHASDPAPVAHASTGAIRGVIASIDGIQRLVIPGLGPVIASGVMASGATATGSGALSTMLIAFGVPDTEAVRYARRITAGHFFLAIQTPHSGAGDRAREIFMAGKADDICTKLDVDRPRLSSSRGLVARSASSAA